MEPPESPHSPITALPDINSTPSETKKPKLFHEEDAVVEERAEYPNGVSLASASSSPESTSKPNGDSSVIHPVPLELVTQEEKWYTLTMAWSGKTYELKVGASDMVYDFKAMIHNLTRVPPVRQKLIGLTKGKLSDEYDSTRFGNLGVKKTGKFTMIGTPEEDSFKDPAVLTEKYDDFDVTYERKKLAETGASKGANPNSRLVSPANDPRNLRKIEEIVKAHPITVMNEPRPGKRLLVLDLDYTIVDTKPLIAGALPSEECARPGLHEFLELVYPYYDIVIWSQTHWRWLESKLVEIGMIGGDRNYKPYKHEVKPLAYFWASFPHWCVDMKNLGTIADFQPVRSAQNTIHIDDLSRNFAMNPGEGLKIRAYNTAGTLDGLEDRELSRLGDYLVHLAEKVEDFATVDHAVSLSGSRVRGVPADDIQRWKKTPALRLPKPQPQAVQSPPPPPPPPASSN
ncbi:ubiquitin-like domain-containing CTD phosphatase 1, partial [Tremellales sp. Uapishka_1]